jgi:hypothetical protein
VSDLTRKLDDTVDAVRDAVIPDDSDERLTQLFVIQVLGEELLARGRRLMDRERRWRQEHPTLEGRLAARREILSRESPPPDEDPPPEEEPPPPPPPPTRPGR